MEHGMLIRSLLRDDTIVGANKEVLGVVEDYFELSLRTEIWCASLQKSVKKARDYQIIIGRALAVQEPQIPLSEEDCKKITDELRIFMSVAAGELICADEFRSVYNTHVEMQSKFGIVKRKVDETLKYFKGLIKGCSIAVGHVKRLSQRFVYERDQRLKSVASCTSEQALVEYMNMGTFLSCKNMETTRVLVNRLEGEVGRIVTSIRFGERHGNCYALLLAIERIRIQQAGFLKLLDEFAKHVDACYKAICNARAAVLQKLTTIRKMEGNSASGTAFAGTLLYSLYIIVYARCRRHTGNNQD